MGISYNPRNDRGRAAYRARNIAFYTALLGLVTTLMPQHGGAQQAANDVPMLSRIIDTKPTEIENATNIKAQPLALLAKFPDAGPAMARYVAQQLAQQPAIIDAMLSVINDTSPAQASAMGAGMVRAVRTIGAQQPAASRSITEKVMRSDNKYLTTTFASLGPSYSASNPSATPSLALRRDSVTANIGVGIGAAWRIGPAENENFTAANGAGNDDELIRDCQILSNAYSNGHCRGMVVAMMMSNASSNGAVSTSPTM